MAAVQGGLAMHRGPGVCPRFGSGAVEAAPWDPTSWGSRHENAAPEPGRASAPQLQDL